MIETAIRKVMRCVFRPGIWFVNWAIAQGQTLQNAKLLKKLSAADPVCKSSRALARAVTKSL